MIGAFNRGEILLRLALASTFREAGILSFLVIYLSAELGAVIVNRYSVNICQMCDERGRKMMRLSAKVNFSLNFKGHTSL